MFIRRDVPKQLFFSYIAIVFINLLLHLLQEIHKPTQAPYIVHRNHHSQGFISNWSRENLTDSIESIIASHTKYEPLLDNKDDRGEVKSLSYIAVKGLPYFATNDNNAIQLIEKSAEWSTGLDNIHAIKMYELFYYLHRNNLADRTAMKMLYKYHYYMTDWEKGANPNWGDFSTNMDCLYESNFK